VKGALGEKKRESFEGEAVSRHDEIEAERLLQAGIRALALAGIKEVKRLRKNDKRKQALVWLVKSRTVVGHEWILDRLEDGAPQQCHPSDGWISKWGRQGNKRPQSKNDQMLGQTPFTARLDDFPLFVEPGHRQSRQVYGRLGDSAKQAGFRQCLRDSVGIVPSPCRAR